MKYKAFTVLIIDGTFVKLFGNKNSWFALLQIYKKVNLKIGQFWGLLVPEVNFTFSWAAEAKIGTALYYVLNMSLNPLLDTGYHQK